MLIYHLTRQEYSQNPFSGIGAKLYGGRWNSKDVECLYCSDSESLCTLGILVHVKNEPSITDLYDLYRLSIPDNLITTLEEQDYPDLWRNIPVHESTQKLGDDFINEPNNPFAVLQVPSIISPRDHNYVVNPNHIDLQGVFSQSKILNFEFDLRIFD